MTRSATTEELEAAATHIFELSKMMRLANQRQKKAGNYELTDYEFLVLDALTDGTAMTVGQVQRRVGVSASQMSRVIRSLEDEERGKLVSASINPDDKRTFNLNITLEGRRALQEYRQLCIGRTAEMLRDLSPEERGEFIHIFDRMRDIFARKEV